MLLGMKTQLICLALLVAVPACATSRSGSERDGETASEDGGAHVPDEQVPDATAADCWIGEGDFQTNDMAFGSAFGAAKQACDSEIGWACGEVFIELDDGGCLVTATGDLNMSMEADAQWLDCVATRLSPTCSRCEASETRRFYESCTIL